MSKSIKQKVKDFFSPKGGAWLLSPGLTRQGEEHTIGNLEQYASIVSKSIAHLQDAVKAYEESNLSLFRLSIDEIVAGWEDAERIRWDTFNHIADKRLFFPESRESMLRLVNTINRAFLLVIDIRLVSFPKEKMSLELSFSVDAILENCVQNADLLYSAIKYLNRDPSHVVSISRQTSNRELDFITSMDKATSHLANNGSESKRDEIFDFLGRLSTINRGLLDAIYEIQQIAIKFV
jgi:uncharacterized protein Yka (UPF0111/DUF47 family)